MSSVHESVQPAKLGLNEEMLTGYMFCCDAAETNIFLMAINQQGHEEKPFVIPAKL